MRYFDDLYSKSVPKDELEILHLPLANGYCGVLVELFGHIATSISENLNLRGKHGIAMTVHIYNCGRDNEIRTDAASWRGVEVSKH